MTAIHALQTFVRSTAGRSILAAYTAAVLLVFPPLLSWLVAIGLLAFSLKQLWRLVRRADSEKSASPSVHQPENIALTSRGDPSFPHFDVEVVLQAAQSHDRRTASSQNGLPVV